MSTDTCPICLEELIENIHVTRCVHKFHKGCIEAVKNNICPLCRTDLKQPKEELIEEKKVEKDIDRCEKVLELVERLVSNVKRELEANIRVIETYYPERNWKQPVSMMKKAIEMMDKFSISLEIGRIPHLDFVFIGEERLAKRIYQKLMDDVMDILANVTHQFPGFSDRINI